MRHKSILINSLKHSFYLIRKNISLFLLLFILQIIFFVVFSFVNSTYQTKILESAKAISDYLNTQNLDEITMTENILQQKSILGDDPLMISRNFNDILRNFRLYLIYMFILLNIFISFFWALTNRLIYKINFKKTIKNFLKNMSVLFFYLGFVFLFFFSLFNISFAEVAVGSKAFIAKYAVFLIFSIIFLYFMFVSLSLLHNTSLKNIVQKTLLVGIKKMHYILAVYLINILLFGISIFLLTFFVEKNLFVLLLSLILMIFSFVFGRIFLANAVEKLV